jgi:hypothetical protein
MNRLLLARRGGFGENLKWPRDLTEDKPESIDLTPPPLKSARAFQLLASTALLFLAAISAAATEVVNWGDAEWSLRLDPETGALVQIAQTRDPHAINWLREAGHWEKSVWRRDTRPDAARFASPWGLVETTHTGPLFAPSKLTRLSDKAWEATYVAQTLTVTVQRELGDDGVLHERYTFTNTGRLALDLPVGSVSLTAPLFDQYPNARDCLAARCHVHLWMGGHSAWINAVPMSGTGPHLGLVMTDGALAAYSQRGGTINDRGTFLLHPAAMRLAPGTSATLGWQLFWHNGWDDFFARACRVPSFVRLSAARHTVRIGEPLEIAAESGASLEGAKLLVDGQPVAAKVDGRKLTASVPTTRFGDMRVELESDGRHTWLRAFVTPAPLDLIGRRVEFIVRHQQRRAAGDPLDGAYLIFDNSAGEQIYAAKPSDHNAGRERVGMGVLGALYLPLCRDEGFRAELRASLDRYVAFVKRELQDDTGNVHGSVGRRDGERRYNAPWVAHLHLAMYRATGDLTHLRDFVRTCKAYYASGGAKFYCIGMPVLAGLQALADAGLATERAELLHSFQTHADHFLAVGGDYPTSEVNYEQSIVAPAVQLLLEVHRATGDARYLEGARRQLVFLEAFNGRQPDHHLHEIAIRHWDDYWFGQRAVYGDTFPHYWSTLTGGVFALYADITGDAGYRRRAADALDNNLSLFTPDGHASCAYVYPLTTNGQPGAFYDPWANDQDWALVNWIEWRSTPAAQPPSKAASVS